MIKLRIIKGWPSSIIQLFVDSLVHMISQHLLDDWSLVFQVRGRSPAWGRNRHHRGLIQRLWNKRKVPRFIKRDWLSLTIDENRRCCIKLLIYRWNDEWIWGQKWVTLGGVESYLGFAWPNFGTTSPSNSPDKRIFGRTALGWFHMRKARPEKHPNIPSGYD